MPWMALIALSALMPWMALIALLALMPWMALIALLALMPSLALIALLALMPLIALIALLAFIALLALIASLALIQLIGFDCSTGSIASDETPLGLAFSPPLRLGILSVCYLIWHSCLRFDQPFLRYSTGHSCPPLDLALMPV